MPELEPFNIKFRDLETEETLVDLDQLIYCLEPFKNLFKNVDESFHDGIAVRWIIKDSGIGSFELSTAPIETNTHLVNTMRLNRVWSWYYDIQEQDKYPAGCNAEGFKNLINCYDRLRKKNLGATISRSGTKIDINKKLKDNANKFLGKLYRYEDEINGVLYGVVLPENKKKWKIYIETNLGESILCYFHSDHEDITQKAVDNLQKYVKIKGLVECHASLLTPSRINIHDIIPLDIKSLPTWNDAYGAMPEIKNSQYINEFLEKEKRNEEFR